MLVSAAAARWSVDAATCRAERGAVLHPASGRTLHYADLAQEASELPVPTDVPLKAAADFRLIGRSSRRLDTPDKVNGRAVYGIDVKIGGMKVAAVMHCPVEGGRLVSLDETATRRVPGVIDVLRIADAAAVVADGYWQARKGVDALLPEWDFGDRAHVSSESISREQAEAAAKGTPIAALSRGDVAAGFEAAVRTVEATYTLPFLAHATMEPINTTVHVRSDGCDIWVGTQTPVAAQALAAGITGLPKHAVRVHNQLLGGGFGRRLQADTIEQAVEFARQTSHPVKFIWTREQDIKGDRFRPSYLDHIAAALGPDGFPIAWTHRVTSGTMRKYFDAGGWPEGKLDKDAVDGAWDMPYEPPAVRIDWVRQDPPVKLNWWRGVGPTHNTFVVESFVDELARVAGRDPIAYRRAMLSHEPRARAVLDIVAERAGWGTPLAATSVDYFAARFLRPLPSGRAPSGGDGGDEASSGRDANTCHGSCRVRRVRVHQKRFSRRALWRSHEPAAPTRPSRNRRASPCP